MLTEFLRPPPLLLSGATVLRGGDVLGEVTNSVDFLVGVFAFLPEPKVLLLLFPLLVGVCVPLTLFYELLSFIFLEGESF